MATVSCGRDTWNRSNALRFTLFDSLISDVNFEVERSANLAGRKFSKIVKPVIRTRIFKRNVWKDKFVIERLESDQFDWLWVKLRLKRNFRENKIYVLEKLERLQSEIILLPTIEKRVNRFETDQMDVKTIGFVENFLYSSATVILITCFIRNILYLSASLVSTESSFFLFFFFSS